MKARVKTRVVVETRAGGLQRELVRCGKAKCKRCRRRATHGPYWYRYTSKAGRMVSTYVGKELPK